MLKEVKLKKKSKTEVVLDEDETFEILPDIETRQVLYVAGPSGSGKTEFSLQYIRNYLNINKNKDFYLFSRTPWEDDPAYKKLKLKPKQVIIDERLIDDPVDIADELVEGCIIFFDDCNTIHNDKIKKEIDKLMADIMEVGRKMQIYIVISNHLVIPNEKKFARTVLNEMNVMCVFPKSGSRYQIEYCLKNYFGYSKGQIKEFLDTDSRWVCFYKNYPQIVITQYEALIP